MKKILFINPGQFGSLIDNYYQCLILRDKYDITYLGLDEGKITPKCEGINIIHLSVVVNKIKHKYLFIRKAISLIKEDSYNFVLINYFVGSSIIRLFSINNLVIDIRTSNISANTYKRFLSNLLLFAEVRQFKNISIISESLRQYLFLPKKTHILPLGAPSLPLIEKDFNTLRILYVGTFHQRNIVNTIFAFAKFLSDKTDKNIAQYTIIGYGSDFEIKNILNAIVETSMEKYIIYKGIIRYPELIHYLKYNNIGMSYIPITSYFDNQPPTKTFEYLLSGMAVIATGTKENIKSVTYQNGVVVGDSFEDISNGLEYIYANRLTFNSKEIQQESQKYSWENIINENLIPYIECF